VCSRGTVVNVGESNCVMCKGCCSVLNSINHKHTRQCQCTVGELEHFMAYRLKSHQAYRLGLALDVVIELHKL
jgi:hypothetical protein